MSTESPNPAGPKVSFCKMLWKEWIKPVGSVLLVMIVVRSSVIDWNDVPSGSMLPTIQIGDRVVVNKLAYGLQIPMGGPYIEIPLTSKRFSNPLKNVPMLRWGSGPQRGEIITFWSPSPIPEHNGIRLIKRVVAIPGDTIEVRDGVVYLNDKPTSCVDVPTAEPRMERHRGSLHALRDAVEQAAGSPQHVVQFIDDIRSLRNMEAVTLGPDQYFCMGDDRDDSADAREWAQKTSANPQGVFLNREQITGHAFGVAWSLDGWSPRGSRFFMKLK